VRASLQPAAAGAAISIYAIWNARNLLAAWLHSPYDRCGSLAFLLWTVPILSLWMTRLLANRARSTRLSSAPFAIALAVSFAGVAADLSALKYLGLAIALSGFLPVQPATFVWLGCAAAWMPAAGWAFSSHGSILVNSMRATIGLAALLLTPRFMSHESVQ
jgi:hypothetical protein